MIVHFLISSYFVLLFRLCIKVSSLKVNIVQSSCSFYSQKYSAWCSSFIHKLGR
uniref:Uncharacterized protein n=1 Tax=Oryza brachyantha TaxID=4533 RepID=J3N939_ORYBR